MRIGIATGSALTGNPTTTHGLTILPGDTLVAILACNNDNNTPTDNNGDTPFTKQVEDPDDPNTSNYSVWYRIAGASEPGTFGWTLATSQRWSLALLQYRDVDVVNVFDLVPSAATEVVGGVDSPLTTRAGLATVTAGATALAVFVQDLNGITHGNPDNGYASLVKLNVGQTLTIGERLYLAAATALPVVSVTSNNVVDPWSTQHFCLRAAVVVPAPPEPPPPAPTVQATTSRPTTADLIHDALQEIGVLNSVDPASGENAALALRQLNMILSGWQADGFARSAEPFELFTELELPAGYESALLYTLAESLAPAFHVAVPPKTAFNAMEARARIFRATPPALQTQDGGMPGQTRTRTR